MNLLNTPPPRVLKPEELEQVVCPHCGCAEFYRYITLRLVKALEFPEFCQNGMNGVLELGKLRCLSCEKDFEFNPNENKKEIMS